MVDYKCNVRDDDNDNDDDNEDDTIFYFSKFQSYSDPYFEENVGENHLLF